MRTILLFPITLLLFFTACKEIDRQAVNPSYDIRLDSQENTISVIGPDENIVLVQNALPDFRPYIHPLQSPDGIGSVTEYSPGHHKHQTGIYWGFTRVNGRDFFHHPGDGFWRRIDFKVIRDSTPELRWFTRYEMLDSLGEVLMTETQNWSFREEEGKYLLDLVWQGQAAQDITIGEYDYGGLFIRMPWKEGMPAEVFNAARDRDQRAEGKRAMWLDLAMQVEGREDMVHLAIFDHPQNGGFPQPWRVDGQFGVGPCRARLGNWQIPKGHTEIIQHRLEVSTEELSDLELNRRWEQYSGSDGMYSTASLWGVAQDEGHSAKFLTPEEAVAEMTVKQGFEVNVWAAEPDITQPMAFCWDHRGRLWVAENRDYESRGDGFSNSGDSRILILEDTNHDGIADHRKVFLEGIPFPAAIAVGFEGLFLGAPPHLLFVPDKDHNDRADVDDIEIRLTGWGIRDRHETLNSMHWGPDGWLYGCQGFATPSMIRKPDAQARLYKHRDPFPPDLLENEGTEINGGVWRYHPIKDIFEVVAHGFSNPWGIDYDAHGQLFITACVIPHLWHIIPGGIYQRQGGQHFNPYVYQDIQTIADHRHRSAHGGARIYQSDAFPAEQRDRIFMANIHEHAILTDILRPKGSGFVGIHGEDFLLANNAQWIGFSLEIGPDGGVYVLDWHDADICGKEVVNKETGRIFRIMPETSGAQDWEGRYHDLTAFTDLELAKMQANPSNWHVRRARLILQERGSQGALNDDAVRVLNDLLTNRTNTPVRLNALWSLHVSNQLVQKQLIDLLADPDPYLRAWSIQLLCEKPGQGDAIKASLDAVAARESSPVVRLYLASAMQRLSMENRWNILGSLLSMTQDSNDHNIPLMLWYAMEPMVEKDPARVLELVEGSDFSLINHFTARRLVDGNRFEDLVKLLNPKQDNIRDLLKGILAALEGRTDIEEPVGWQEKSALLSRQGSEIERLTGQINQQLGSQEAIRQMLSILEKSTNLSDRKDAIIQLSLRKVNELIPYLPNLLEDQNTRKEAIQAIARYDDFRLGTMLMEKYQELPPDLKPVVINTMSARPRYGGILARAIADGTIPRKDIPAYVARQLRRVVGSGFVEIWGPIDEPDTDIQESYIRYRNIVRTRQIDPDAGEKLFETTCGPCHVMYGKGGKIGPELTGSNRTNLDYLLTNILEPNAEMQDDYRMVIVSLRDGRTLMGNKIGENERQLTLRIVGQDELTINKAEIQSTETTEVSLMPAGLLHNLQDQEVANLLGYLMQVQL